MVIFAANCGICCHLSRPQRQRIFSEGGRFIGHLISVIDTFVSRFGHEKLFPYSFHFCGGILTLIWEQIR